MHPVAERLEPGITDLLSRFAYDLVDVQYLHANGAWVLRVFVEHSQSPRFQPFGGGPMLPGPVSVADCENISRILSAWLDEQDAIPRSYQLEVSSPGLDRVVKHEADFVRFQGKLCRIRTIDPINGTRAHRGRLDGVHDGRVLLAAEGGATVEIPLTQIERANLEPELVFGRPRHK